jgi:two-component system, LytTR family, sensor kinase
MKNFFTGANIRIFLHLLAWSILLGLPMYFIKRWQVGNDFIWVYYINTLVSGIIFYINYLVLVPKFFFQNRKRMYFLSAFIVLVIFNIASDKSNELVFKYISTGNTIEDARETDEATKRDMPGEAGGSTVQPPFRQMHKYNFGFTSLFLVFFSLGMRVIERHTQTEKLQKELEREKLNSELALLKNQISPHFFFNTLNNIYSLISINAEDSKQAVLKLSKLMRYMLYDSESGNILLSKEIAFMNNYIDLMKLRMSDKVNLKISFPGKFNDISVPPLLFIPFIENAFKHGISYREISFIDIRMLPGKDTISFICTNSIFKPREDVESDYPGIGLENVSKRLNLLFPGKHELKINRTAKSFEVVLNINLA